MKLALFYFSPVIFNVILIFIKQKKNYYSNIYTTIPGNRKFQTTIFVLFLVYNIFSNE